MQTLQLPSMHSNGFNTSSFSNLPSGLQLPIPNPRPSQERLSNRNQQKKNQNNSPCSIPIPPHSQSDSTGSLLTKRELTDDTLISLFDSVLQRIISKNSDLCMPSWEDCVSMYYSARPVNVDIRFYFASLVRHLHCSRSAFIVALVYLHRLQVENSMLALNEFNVHRLLITAVLLASKTLDDRVYSNSHFARVAGIPTVAELNRLEWNMFTMLDFKTHVDQEEYVSFVLQMSTHRAPVLQSGRRAKAAAGWDCEPEVCCEDATVSTPQKSPPVSTGCKNCLVSNENNIMAPRKIVM